MQQCHLPACIVASGQMKSVENCIVGLPEGWLQKAGRALVSALSPADSLLLIGSPVDLQSSQLYTPCARGCWCAHLC